MAPKVSFKLISSKEDEFVTFYYNLKYIPRRGEIVKLNLKQCPVTEVHQVQYHLGYPDDVIVFLKECTESKEEG